MSLPAELETLEQQYAEFFASYQAGALSETDLRATAENLIAVDGNGARWKLNLDGEGFLRAWPGGSFSPAYPEEFAPLSVPPTTAVDNSDAFSWQTPPGHTPPPRQTDYHPYEIDPHAPTYTQPAAPSRVGQAVASVGAAKQKWAALPPKRRRIILVAAACVLLLLAISARGSDDNTDGTTTPVPVATTVPPSNAPLDTTPATAPETTPPTDSVVPVAGPDSVRIQEVVTLLTSANRDQIVGVVADPGEPADFWRKASIWSGMQRLGLVIDTSAPVTVVSDSAAQQVWTIVNSIDGTAVLTATVDWTFDGERWRPYTVPGVQGV